jgi:Carboxypeptidase regulatory-like domain
MKRIVIGTLSVLLVTVFCSVPMWAQATAQISGTVKDQTGAVLPGVEITATHTDTSIVRTAITNETGSYVLPNLAVGPYRLEAALPGFRSFAQSGIVLQVNGSPAINPVLEVGQVTESVEIQANAALVETRNSSVGQVIENQQVLELPLNGRNVAELITLAGGTVSFGTVNSRMSAATTIQVAAAGSLGFGTDYRLDGADSVNFLVGSAIAMPFPDALQEFKVETSGVNAQNGNGSAISGVTKSGTNTLHGDLFEFVRNDLFNARPYFATKGSTLKRNQYGGTLGGPIAKNKLFFFGGYQGTILRQDPADVKAFVPTAAMLAGDWTTFASPVCNAGRQISLRAPFVNNQINPSQYNRVALNILNKTLLPGVPTPNACGEITYGKRNNQDEKQYTAKVDYQWTAKHSLFGRFLAVSFKNPLYYMKDPSNPLTNGRDFNDLAQSYALGDTYLISSNTVNALRLSVNRNAIGALSGDHISGCDVGINMYCGYNPHNLDLVITGGFTLAGYDLPGDGYKTTSYHLSDDVSILRGGHQFSIGGNAFHGRSARGLGHYQSAGNFAFNGQETGLGMADFFVGKASSLNQSGEAVEGLKQTLIAAYGNDTWKVTPKLTMTYGVRWQPYIPQVNTNGRTYSFDYGRFQKGVKSNVFANAPAGLYFPDDPGFLGLKGIKNRLLQFAPRAGLAWDLKGDGRTSIRASYGYSYAFVSAIWHEDVAFTGPWANWAVLAGPLALENPWQNFPGGNPFPFSTGPNAPFVNYGLFINVHDNIKTPAMSSWNLSVQRQVATSWIVSATYLGTELSHVWTHNPLNNSTFLGLGPCTLNGVSYTTCSTTANTDQRRRLSLERPQDGLKMGTMVDLDDGATQSYQGMVLDLKRRASHGVTLGGNYTLSHCIGPYTDSTSAGPDARESNQLFNNRNFDRGNCTADRRHVFNWTAVAELPQFANRTLHAVASGWSLSGIYRLSSGQPITVISGSDRALTGVNNQRADQVLGNPYLDKSLRPMSQFLNPAAFALPALGTEGNVGRGSIRGVPIWAFDMGLSRSFSVRESQKLEFRAEAYNVTNSFRAALGGGGNLNSVGLNSNTFGQVRASLDPRIMQFAVKYIF